MTTTVAAPVAATPVVDTNLDLDARLALADVAMTVRLDEAATKFDINTAYLPGADPIPEITAPLPLTPTAVPDDPYTTPIAGTLHRARTRIMQDGWCRDAAFDDAGAVCPIRAIRLEAADRYTADDACVLLLDVIQQDFRDAETIPSWNAEQTSAAPVLLCLGRAADHAHNQGL